MWVLHPGRIGIWLVLQEGEKHSEQGENQQQIQPTYGTGPESNPGHIGGRKVLSPLRHPYSSKQLRQLAPCP